MMVDLRQSADYGKYIGAIGWQALRINGCQVLIRRLPLIGSLMKIQRPGEIPFKKIVELARKKRAVVIKIEPIINHQSLIINHGFHRDSWPLLPSKTVRLDLKKSLVCLRSGMTKEARYCLRKAEKEGLKIEKNPSVQQFYSLFQQFGKGYLPKEKEFQALTSAFEKKAFLITVDDSAGALILRHDKIAYYYFAFTSPAGRRKFAQYLAVWEAIKLAKKSGCRLFDFEGIEDVRYKVTRLWQGFSHFKKSFGGKEVEFPGSFVKYSLPGIT